MDEASPGRSPPLAPGLTIDRYELTSRVRGDDAGEVWLAREVTEGAARVVALRFVPPRLVSDDRLGVLLRQEVKLAAGVAHPNVAQVLGVVGDVAVASEWVEGETLADLRDAAATSLSRAIPVPVLLRVLADACAGLHAAHLVRDRSGSLLNVVHGDVSARSIVVGTTGVSRVIDLGLMKALARHAGGANLTWRASARATADGVQRIDRHADVWGIGAILAQALDDAGSPGDAVAADGAGPSVHSLVGELVHRAQSTDAVERFATAAEMQGAIEAAMMTLGISATRAHVAAFAKGLVRGRAEAAAAARAKALGAISIPTPVVDSVPATAQTLHPAGERVIASGAPVDVPIASPPPAPTPPAAITASASSRTIAPARGARGRASLFVAGFAVAVLGAGASGYLAMRAHAPAARVVLGSSPLAASPVRAQCPAGTLAVPASTPQQVCIDAAPVTVEAYKACSDSGDCKRAAVENRWPGITPHDHAAYDALCHEHDPRLHGAEPANCVDRGMAAGYCEAHGARLPTDVELAASPSAPDGAFSEWGSQVNEAAAGAGTRSYAIGFRCARSLSR